MRKLEQGSQPEERTKHADAWCKADCMFFSCFLCFLVLDPKASPIADPAGIEDPFFATFFVFLAPPVYEKLQAPGAAQIPRLEDGARLQLPQLKLSMLQPVGDPGHGKHRATHTNLPAQ